MELEESGRIVFRYVLRAQIPRVRIPPPQPVERADGFGSTRVSKPLSWRPARRATTSSISRRRGQWAVYRFEATAREFVRAPRCTAGNLGPPLRRSSRARGGRAPADLTAWQGRPRCKLALTAVVEDDNGTLSYWALKHAPGKPDFHHPDGFVLELTSDSMKFGIDRLLDEPELRKPLAGACGPVGPSRLSDPQSRPFARCAGDSRRVRLSAAFGPQHGLRGDKQDNMVESPDYNDPVHGIPVFSLYGEVRRPTPAMMDTFDVLLVDLQDLGCRIYTFVTTLRYVLEEAAKTRKEVWVLDRPNPDRPAGRRADAAPGLRELRGRRRRCRCATA